MCMRDWQNLLARCWTRHRRDMEGSVAASAHILISLTHGIHSENLAGAPGLEPGNGGIKIHLVRIIHQHAFRKIAAIRLQWVQDVRGYFGMPAPSPRCRRAISSRP